MTKHSAKAKKIREKRETKKIKKISKTIKKLDVEVFKSDSQVQTNRLLVARTYLELIKERPSTYASYPLSISDLLFHVLRLQNHSPKQLKNQKHCLPKLMNLANTTFTVSLPSESMPQMSNMSVFHRL